MITNKYYAILPVIFRQKEGLIKLFLLAVLAALITALMPWPLKILVDYALVDNDLTLLKSFSSTHLVLLAALFSLTLFALNSAMAVGSSWLWSKVGQLMVIDLSLRLFDRLQKLSRVYHNKKPVADSLNRLTVDSWCVFSIAQSLLITPVQNILTILVITAIAWQLDSYLTLVSLALAPLLAFSTLFLGNRMKEHSIRVREKESGVMAFVHQTLGSMPLVHAFSREKLNLKTFRSLSKETIEASKKNTLVDQSYDLINGLVLSSGLAIVLFLGSGRVIAELISVGSLLVFIGYLTTLQGEAQSLLSTFKNLKTAEASLGRVMEIIETPDSTMDTEKSKILTRFTRMRASGVKFEHVSFAYEPENPILKDINLTIEAGQTVALVGESGGGKSTLASLIPRFIDASEGDIFIANEKIRDISISSLRDRVSLVLQDPYLQPMSIADNIAYGKPNATREEIIQAATTANASAFIRRLPEGYETILGERGVNLSGGQRQRLSIARALLKDAPILILDEPTSALDTQTESLFMAALHELMKGRTTIIVAHRLSTIKSADKIVVLQKGQIAEQGTHEELMELDGLYAGMYKLQAIDHGKEATQDDNGNHGAQAA